MIKTFNYELSNQCCVPYDDSKTYIHWHELIELLAHLDNPIGDLCSDIIREGKYIDVEEDNMKLFLTNIAIRHPVTDEAVRRLKTIYTTIYNSVIHK